MRLLKKSGMNKDKLNNSKLDLDDSLKTYKYGGEVFYKTPIMKRFKYLLGDLHLIIELEIILKNLVEILILFIQI